MTTPVNDPELQRQAELLLSTEAYFLDHRLYDEWLALYTEDALYSVPNYDEHGGPDGGGVIVSETKADLMAHVGRLLHPLALTEQPPPRTRRLVSNVLLWPEVDGRQPVTSSVAVFISRLGCHVQLVGTYQHELERKGQDWRIAQKRVYLLTNDQPLELLPLL